jgi:small GTP-binding protein
MVLKLVISGDVGSGKTTFIKAISDIEPITTDEVVTEEKISQIKSQTTVALDFGMMKIDADLMLHIYATPGQKRFDFMWDILMKNAVGVVFLADASRVDSILATNEIINYFKQKFSIFPYIICVTKLDLPNSLSFDASVELLQTDACILPINANNTADVRDAVIALVNIAIHHT